MPRYRIFVKIYLWFWLATIGMILTMFAIQRIVEERRPFASEMEFVFGSVFSYNGQAAAEILEREGVSSLNAFFDRLKHTSNIDFFLFDDHGGEITGKKDSKKLEGVVALAEKNPGNEFFWGKTGISAQRVSGPSGKKYIIAGFLPKPHPKLFHEKPSLFLIRLIFLVIISGVGCYILARYITAPIVKLGHAVRQFAAGNHSVRVSPEMGGWRDEFSGLASDFDLMAGRIESLLTSQRNLLRDISHELRSPLSRLSVALELCRQRSDISAEKSLDRIEREADKLNELIGQILTLNRYESGMSLPDVTDVDMAKLIREVTDDADFEAQGVNRSVKLMACAECTIKGSEESLRRAVENVVRNAVLHTDEDSTVEVFLSRVAKRESGSYISIVVRDYGPGVPEDEIPHLFKPFYRVGNDRDRQTGGAGIGLAITDAAVRSHGGRVKALNTSTGGLLVEISIPER